MKTATELRMAAVASPLAECDAYTAAIAGTGTWDAYTDAVRFRAVAEAELEAAGLTLHEPPTASEDDSVYVEHIPYHGAVDISGVCNG